MKNSRIVFQIKSVAAGLEKRFGKIDILVNNASTSIDGDLSSNSTMTVSPGNLRRTFDINFIGLVELTQKLLPLIGKSEKGRIVNISSNMGSLAVFSR